MKRKFEKIIIAGKGSILKSCLKIAEEAYPEADCETYEPVKKSEFMEFLRALEKETLIVSVMNPYIIQKDIIEKENLLIINVHHALLPKHPGLNAVAWTIWNGDREGGITWHYVDSGIDSGKIILKKSIPVDENMTSSKLMQKSKILMLEGLKEILPIAETGDAEDDLNEGSVQSSEIPHGPKDTINNAMIDHDWDFEKVSRFLRAMDFGFLHPMGIPKILLDGKISEILSYSIYRAETKDDIGEGIEYQSDKNIVKLRFENGSIELRIKEQ